MSKQVFTAKKYRQEKKVKQIVASFTRELLSNAGDEIARAAENEKNACALKVNTNFNIPGMNNADVQRDVYYNAARALEKAGYNVRIKYSGTRAENQEVIFMIAWISKKELEERAAKDKYLQSISC